MSNVQEEKLEHEISTLRDRIADLEGQLAAANKRNEEMTAQYRKLVTAGMETWAEYERKFVQAQRKLETARSKHFAEFLELTCKLNPWIDRSRMEQALRSHGHHDEVQTKKEQE